MVEAHGGGETGGRQIRKVQLDEREDFSERQSYGRRVVTPVRYSTDPRDVGWVRENIPCQTACPADTNVPAYIQMILENRYGRSYEINRYANVLPGVLGRICSRPCEDACRHGWPGNGAPVNICHLKRCRRRPEAVRPPHHREPVHAVRQADRGGRRRPRRHRRRARSLDARPRRHHPRAGERAGRHAVLRHPRVPPAARGALGRGAQRAAPRRRPAHRRAGRQGRGRGPALKPAAGLRRGAADHGLHGGDPAARARRRRTAATSRARSRTSSMVSTS